MSTSVIVPAQTVVGLGPADMANYLSGTYWATDMLGNEPLTALTSGTGSMIYGLPTPGGAPTVPTGWTAAQLNQHLGFITTSTAALNDAATGAIVQNVPAANLFSGAPSWTATIVFTTPNVLSTAADRYLFRVGWGSYNSASSLNGIYLSYSDNQNSGNWVLAQGQGATIGDNILVVGTIVAPVAGTWNTLQLTKTAGTKLMTATLNGTVIASGNAFSTDPMSGGGPAMSLVRNTFTSGTISAFMDYASFYSTGSTRTAQT